MPKPLIHMYILPGDYDLERLMVFRWEAVDVDTEQALHDSVIPLHMVFGLAERPSEEQEYYILLSAGGVPGVECFIPGLVACTVVVSDARLWDEICQDIATRAAPALGISPERIQMHDLCA